MVFALPYYTVYYTSLNMVAGQSIHRSLAELRHMFDCKCYYPSIQFKIGHESLYLNISL